ncbi:MAG: MarR family transcriptional regulator [Clostridia bacterium]|nr:MarR family transcriptional regulator [Clostridia bacterium]
MDGNQFEMFSLIISEISKHLHKMTAELMKQYGLNGSHAMYFLAFYRYPDGMSASQICEQCCRDKSDVSRTVSVLTDKGFLIKEASPKIQHRTVFKLSDKGKETAEHLLEKVNYFSELLEAKLGAERQEELYESLKSVLYMLSEYNKR